MESGRRLGRAFDFRVAAHKFDLAEKITAGNQLATSRRGRVRLSMRSVRRMDAADATAEIGSVR